MVVVQLHGGLGNQMFQYAAAHSLASKYGTTVRLDVSKFENYTLRNFDLGMFDAQLSFVTEEELKLFARDKMLSRALERAKPYARRSFYKEPFFHFDSSFFKLVPPVFIKGYFQSEKYFLHNRAALMKVFQFRNESVGHLSIPDLLLPEANTVAIHLRRGDYKDKVAQQVHGMLPMTYYEKAIKKISELVDKPYFLIFTDDIDFAGKAFRMENRMIVSGNLTRTHFEDLHLMSRCKHNIIANSSFSWWGAWLNAHPEKVVIAPKNWFNNGPKDTQDLLPDRWIKV